MARTDSPRPRRAGLDERYAGAGWDEPYPEAGLDERYPDASWDEPAPDTRQPKRQLKKGRSAVDAWMDEQFKFAGSSIKRKTLALFLMGIPGLVPLFFLLPAVLTANASTLGQVEPDVLGTGSMLMLMLTLTVTPMVTLTRQRWFIPIRKWFGILIGVTGTTDALLASIVTGFKGGVIGRLVGHTFLMVGFTMVLILLSLTLISNNRAQRWLGKYWKALQRLTYLVWGLLFVHLVLLFGFGIQHGTNGPSGAVDGDPVFHQRVYQLTAVSLPLFLLRLPPIKRWVETRQQEGREWIVLATFMPLAAFYVLGLGFMINEELFQGMQAFTNRPLND